MSSVEPVIRAKPTARLVEWKKLLRKETLWSRQIMTKLLDGKITLTPTRDDSENRHMRCRRNCLSADSSRESLSKWDGVPKRIRVGVGYRIPRFF